MISRTKYYRSKKPPSCADEYPAFPPLCPVANAHRSRNSTEDSAIRDSRDHIMASAEVLAG
jgi:hypothetical protein